MAPDATPAPATTALPHAPHATDRQRTSFRLLALALTACALFAASIPVRADDCTIWVDLMPRERSRHGAAFDAARGVTVVYGGDMLGEMQGDTWEWDGDAWTERQPSVSPSPRNSHTMTFDETRGVVVLFGGADGTHGRSREIWEWDGDTWLLVGEAPIGGVVDHAISYDSRRDRILVFGGVEDSVATGRTVERVPDCNCNGRRDSIDARDGTSKDVNGNGVPDECEPCGRVQRMKARCRVQQTGRTVICRLQSNLPEGTTFIGILDEGEERTLAIGPDGRARAAWKGVDAGQREVCLTDCRDFNLCRAVPCP